MSDLEKAFENMPNLAPDESLGPIPFDFPDDATFEVFTADQPLSVSTQYSYFYRSDGTMFARKSLIWWKPSTWFGRKIIEMKQKSPEQRDP